MRRRGAVGTFSSAEGDDTSSSSTSLARRAGGVFARDLRPRYPGGRTKRGHVVPVPPRLPPLLPAWFKRPGRTEQPLSATPCIIACPGPCLSLRRVAWATRARLCDYRCIHGRSVREAPQVIEGARRSGKVRTHPRELSPGPLLTPTAQASAVQSGARADRQHRRGRTEAPSRPDDRTPTDSAHCTHSVTWSTRLGGSTNPRDRAAVAFTTTW
jgi:hypothetical protein